MHFTYDEIYERLVARNLAKNVIRPSDNQRIRYSDTVTVGDCENGSFILYPSHSTRAGRDMLTTILHEEFDNAENITINKATSPIVISC